MKLCLVVANDHGGHSSNDRKIVQVDDATATIETLYQVARTELLVDSTNSSGGIQGISLHHVVPPRQLVALDEEASTTLTQANIQNMDRIQVTLIHKKDNQSVQSTTVTTTGSSSQTTQPDEQTEQSNINQAAAREQRERRPRSSQRASAQRANESFAQVIQAQDTLLRNEQSKSSFSSKKAVSNKSSDNKKNKLTTRKRTVAQDPTGPGRRLQDGARVGGGGGRISNAKKRAKQQASSFQSQDDVSMALLDALGASSGSNNNKRNNTKVSQVLRATMRNAVSQQYSTSRAFQKVSAVEAHQYTITETSDGYLQVEYSKGLEGRGMFTERVECIPRDALQAVLTAIHQSTDAVVVADKNAETQQQRELLKPTSLALVSPRVFWSLVHLYPVATGGVEEALKLCLPNLDWSFLHKRTRMPSAKALENKRQDVLADSSNNTEEQAQSQQDEVAAQEAVQAVEDAMEQLESYDATQRRERAARAAMARGTTSNTTAATVSNAVAGMTMQSQAQPQESSSWSLITPTEPDDDELKECIAAAAAHPSKAQAESILQAFHGIGIYNWRQLAIANPNVVCEAVIGIPLLDNGGTSNQQRTQASSVVEAWMDYAQQQSIDEILVEICNDRVDVVQVLAEEARTASVKDLANWRHMPDLLYASAPSLAKLKADSSNDESDAAVEVTDLRTWCHRAQAVLEENEWMQWYATPVE